MAQPFLRIDLANQAKDFQNTVIEAGWPLIDKANANYQILRKWLGASVAEPERKGEEVVFYLRNESGARIDQPNVTRAGDKDLMGPLKPEFQALIKKLQSAEPKNTSEKTLHAKALQELQALATEKRAGDRRCCLFKHRDENKKWHLVWAPGYRRKDEQPANPLVCTNPVCSLLFLQRADGNAKCPRCQKTPGVRPVDGSGVKKSILPLAVVLLLIGAVLGGAGWWYFTRDNENPPTPAEAALAVTPSSATITQDGQVAYSVTFTDSEGNEKDVTKEISVVVRSKGEKEFDKTPVKYDIFHNKAEAKGVGKAELEFFYLDDSKNKHTAVATLIVEPRRNPKSVTIEPASVKLGIGTTAQLKMVGEYEDGRKEELTDKAEWNWDDPGQSGFVFAYKGAIQGLNKGKTQLKARYRATPESEYVIAEAAVEVDEVSYKTLHLSLASSKVAVGQDPGVVVEVETESGEKMSVLGSALLKLEVVPKELADVQKQVPYLYPNQAGQGTLKATFRGISKEIPFDVEVGPANTPAVAFQVNPQNLKLAVGEIADIEVPKGSGNEEAKLSSSDLNVVEITPNNRLIGKQPGKATVTVNRGDDSATVKVEVAAVPFTGLAFDPTEVSVRVDDVMALRLMAKIDDDTQVELDPMSSLLEWVRFPPGEYVELDRQALDVRGLAPTGDDQKLLVVRLGQYEATAKVRVIPAPLTLALEPAESLELPVGQKQPLKVIATYGNGQQEEIPASRVEWVANSAEGLSLENGEVTADKPEAGPLTVSVKYVGQTSNEVQIRSIPALPVRMTLTANPSTLAVGETGQAVLSGKTPGGQDVVLDSSGVKFESRDEAIVRVDPRTGGFRAEGQGKVVLKASHPSSRDPLEVEIEVTPPKDDDPRPAPPQGVRIVTTQSPPISLPVGVGFVDFKVIASIDGKDVDVTEEALMVAGGDPQSAAVSLQSGVISGVRPGEATVKAEVGGMTSENELAFTVTENLELDQIKVSPEQVNLGLNENTRLEAIGFHQGRSVGIVTNHPSVKWNADGPAVAGLQGPVVSAIAVGTCNVTAQMDQITSNPAVITVSDSPPGGLSLDPLAITIQPGESVEIGRNVRVLRGRTDLTQQAQVTSANAEIVSYDASTRHLKAGSPGQTRVTFFVGEQTADLSVTVLNEPLALAGGRIVIQPETGVIAVGERLPLRVTLITATGKRVPMTASAEFTTSDPNVAQLNGSGVQGVAPGRGVVIQATVPGVDTPASATFDVSNYDYTSLEISPWRRQLTKGEKHRYRIYANGPAGRRELGNHPDLKLSLKHGDENDRIEVLSNEVLPDGSREIFAEHPTIGGAKTLMVSWKGLETSDSYTVSDNQLSGILTRPQQATIEVGQTVDYQVFGRYAGRLNPLSNADGVEISVVDDVIAARVGPLRIEGKSPGTTEIIAKYEDHLAYAQLTVVPRTSPAAPPARPVGIRFLVNNYRMELGTPGDLVELVYVYPDGSTGEITDQPELTAKKEGIVDIEYRGKVPFIRPKTIGQTQLLANVGAYQTERPMVVEVAKELPGNPRLVINPNPLIMLPGETEAFSRVAFLRAGGRVPVDVPYTITATPNDVFDVENGRVIRAKAPGIANATITMQDPESKYDGMSASAQIQVNAPDNQVVTRLGSQLELRGPSRTTEGSDVAYRVFLMDGSASQEVTNDAKLVLADGDEKIAELQPGCRLIAHKPGRVNLQGVYEGKVSNIVPLTIQPVARSFRQLELALNTEPLGVGETRGYRVWGYPNGGGARQDLTRLVVRDPVHATRPHITFAVLEPSPAANVADHVSPNIVGRNPGKISIQAAIGNRLVSNREEVAVVEVIKDPLNIRLEPGSFSAKVGEATPPFKVLVQTAGAGRYREVEPALVKFTSEKPDTVAPIADSPGRFTAKSPGATRVKVEFGGLEAWVNVNVVSDRFKSVQLGKQLEIGFDKFKAPIIITTDRIAGPLEYRLYQYGTTPQPQDGWKTATANDNEQTVTLVTEELRLVGTSNFRFMLESRRKDDTSDQSIERYPYMFTIGGRAQE